MKAEWKTFLTNAGAEFDGDDRVTSFGNPDLELRVVTTGNVICDLSHQGLISVHGDDAQDFLQNLLTNDVHEVSETHSQLSAHCSPKGRMLTSFRLFKRGDTFYLLLPLSMVEATLKRLRMFVLRSKVTLEDATETFARMGCSGPAMEDELRDALGAVPGQVDEVAQKEGMTILRVPGPHPRFVVAGELDTMKRLWTVLDVRSAPVGAAPWGLLDILAGIPTVYPATLDAFVPQMVNYQLVGGVSFRKGCYPGQEVVARMQYLGRLKRRMYRAHVDTDTPPAPGDELYAPGAENGQGAGKVVDAQPFPGGGFETLAVIQIAAAEAGDVRLGGPEGPRLTLGTLPYPFEEDDMPQRA